MVDIVDGMRHQDIVDVRDNSTRDRSHLVELSLVTTLRWVHHACPPHTMLSRAVFTPYTSRPPYHLMPYTRLGVDASEGEVPYPKTDRLRA